MFEVRMVGRAPVTRWLDRLVRARYLRIVPLEFRHTFYLRAEIMGCRGGEEAFVSLASTRGLTTSIRHLCTPTPGSSDSGLSPLSP